MNLDISTIEREYIQKRTIALKTNEERVKEIYKSSPEILNIDKEIQKLGIEASKKAIFSKDKKTKAQIDALIKKIEELKKSKNTILNEKGISLEPKYECEKCKDTGYITYNMRSQMCTCMKQRLIDNYYNKHNLLHLKSEDFQNFDDSLFSDTPDFEKYGSKISPRDNINRIKKLSLDFVKNFEKEETKNMLFVGSPGIGKTFISGCVANELLKEGKTVLYQTAPLLMDSIFEFKFGENNKSSKELYNSLFNVDLLIIDDLGTENQSAAKFTELFTIINSRMLNPHTKTIISSNFDLKQLSKIYDDRVISRLIGQYTICRFFGDDIRLNKARK